MIKVSVIIPVYNASAFLSQCISTLLQQTIGDCEFIFVNDGSADNSQAIIEKYQENDARIVLINQKNLGVSAARNHGLYVAKGAFIGFVDADDFVTPDLFERFYEAAISKNADIVTGTYITEGKDSRNISTLAFAPDVIFGSAAIKQNIIPILVKENYLNKCWDKIYRRELLISEKIYFPVGMPIGEDGIFNIHAFMNAKAVSFIEFAGYHYREVDGSATRDVLKKDYFNTAIEIFDHDYTNILKGTLTQDEIQKLKASKLINNVLAIIGIYLGKESKSGILKRYSYVKMMIHDKTLQSVVARYGEETGLKMGAYQKFLLNCIKNKNVLLLYLAVMYSNFRNK